MLSAILDVFTEIFQWLRFRFNSAWMVFYDDGQLTFFGILAVASLGISLFFLLIRVVQNFLHFRS